MQEHGLKEASNGQCGDSDVTRLPLCTFSARRCGKLSHPTALLRPSGPMALLWPGVMWPSEAGCLECEMLK